jgi:hypothetical protein
VIGGSVIAFQIYWKKKNLFQQEGFHQVILAPLVVVPVGIGIIEMAKLL